jgi:hypothetical protein
MAKAMGQGTNGKRGKLPAVPLKTKCGLGRCIKTTDLQDCAACKQICYCGKEHQVEHFKEGHKLVCPGRTKGAPLAFQDCVNKASQYFERGMWVAALPYYAAILELTERHAGVFHPQTVLALDGMATCMLKQGKWDELSELLTRILLTKVGPAPCPPPHPAPSCSLPPSLLPRCRTCTTTKASRTAATCTT